MRAFGKWLGLVLLVLVLAGAALWLFGPYEPVDLSAQAVTVPEGIDAHLAESEARFDDIVPGTEKRVVWAGAPGARTPLAVVYIHGFSATSEEIRPVPDRVAEALGANLFFTRLAGHGRDGAAMAEPAVADWMHDLDEALAIGRAIGERVLVIGTSTGATIAAVAAQDDSRAEGVAGFVLVSPNFRIKTGSAALLTWPAARTWVPWLVGPTRSFAPDNELHARYWTESYPVTALMPMAALVKAVRELDFSTVTAPVLVSYSESDMVVDGETTTALLADWGGPLTVDVVAAPQEGMDPSNHVIAGDILSPGRTDAAVATILDWAQKEGLTP